MTVNLKSFFNAGQQALVIFNFQIRVNATLHQNSSSAESKGLLDFLVDHMIRQHVSLWVTLHPIEGTKRTKFPANICVVDVAIDDVADDVIRMEALPNKIGAGGQVDQICLSKQVHRLF